MSAHTSHVMALTQNPAIAFTDAMAQAGIPCPDPIIADGKLHRYKTDDDHAVNCWYVMHADGLPVGVFGCWKRGISEKWCAKDQKQFSDVERKAWRERMECLKQERDKAQVETRAEARTNATEIMRAAESETGAHPYLQRKKIKTYQGARCGRWEQRHKDGCLLIPMHDADGVLWNVQAIFPEKDAVLGRDKDYLSGATKRGLYFAIGTPDGVLCIAEGYATAASIHEATGHAIAVAFDAGNLKPVAEALRAKYPNVRIIVCADNDISPDGKPNTGVIEAGKAARAVGGFMAIPAMNGMKCDFNDLANLEGPDAVQRCIASAARIEQTQEKLNDPHWTPDQVRSIPWADPLPLVHQSEARPYLLDELPGRIGAAVREVADFAQCPISLAACSALSALSLAGQALVNVRRSEGLTGPVSLYFLAIAESGERKTTCDERFMLSIRKWEEQQTENAKPDVARHEAAKRAWEAKCEGILNAIKQGAKNDKPTAKQEAELRQLEFQKPQPPRVPSLLLDDNTPEAIAWKLADKWPSQGSISSEAGVVFGGLGMGKDSIMRNLALLNKLWDGGTHKVDRRTTESFIVRGVRLTIGLAVQPVTVREFFELSKGLARGTGFAARFLIANEKSTQGYRPFKEAPRNWPCLLAFHTRLVELLEGAPSLNDRGELDPVVLDLSPEAKAAWISFHDEIERELRPGGDMEEVKDVASKAADNAARLAALFHLFEVGPRGPISAEHLQRAGRIVAWHLYEARRFLGEIVLPKALNNAAKLHAWLRNYCRDHQTSIIATREVQRNGPYALRDKRALDDATRELSEARHVRLGMDGRQKLIYVNPALLSDGHGA